MQFINSKGEYPRYLGDLLIENPSFKIGDDLPTGWIEVKETNPPKITDSQVLEIVAPVEKDGVMTQNWQVRDMTAEEIERRDAPKRAKEKLIALGLTEVEIDALLRGLR